ncbi:putative methyltransferase-domain-containing protein [Crucibulum laeve]|uniref:Putative methyltransferase-domain-containing protein n=1 Tax=Crucibulum laeve TaxID=68775 RepID=A0A5C3MC11_9AGAR|nr:putative methyltransferase-domain-containing protein [Crucibulum laeve]
MDGINSTIPYPTAPTSSLPALGRLRGHSTKQIQDALSNLQLLYWPPASPPLPAKLALPKRVTRHLIHDDSVPDSGYASAEGEDDDEEDRESQQVHESSENEQDEELELLRCDPFERNFAIKWVTGFVSRSDVWVEASTSEEEAELRSEILEQVISILSAFSGGEEETEVALTRTFSFLTHTPEEEIKVELNDAPLSSNDHTSVGLQSWGSAILLAERMCKDPAEFSLVTHKPLRILELGAGTGLLSIVAAKLLPLTTTKIVATDYHPDVLANLSQNVLTNFPAPSTRIEVLPLDWESPKYTAPLDAPFDIILAADVIYYPEHAKWIKGCVEQLLARPSPESPEGGVFWLIIPLRTTGRHEGMSCTVDALFPDVSNLTGLDSELAVLYREESGRHVGVGRADEGGYKLFKIGWANAKVGV